MNHNKERPFARLLPAESLRYSVVRRSLAVTAVFVFGHLFHYALMLVSNRILDAASFGRFSASISLLNILLTPATVFTFIFANHFSAIFSGAGTEPLRDELNGLLVRHGLLGAGLAALATAALLVVGRFVGADAVLLLLLVPAVALSIYLFEMVRAALQGMLDFFWYSVMWIGWRFGQFAIAGVAIILTATAWAGIAGILVATVAALAFELLLVYRRLAVVPAVVNPVPSLPLSGSLPFLCEYGVFILVNNIDVLMAYVLLGNEQLGIYAASSFLPKAIVTATQPVSQVMLPVMKAFTGRAPMRRAAVLKAVLVSAVLGGIGAGVLYAGSDLVCDERFGVRFCNTALLAMLAFAAIPLGVVRVLMVAELAGGRTRHALVSAAMIIPFVAIAFAGSASPDALGEIYMVFCWIFGACYGLTALWRSAKVAKLTAAHSRNVTAPAGTSDFSRPK